MRFISILLLILIFGCREKPRVQTQSEGRDLIMNQYIHVLDSISSIDSLDSDYKLLKAYNRNDTSYLKNSYSELLEGIKYLNALESTFCEQPRAINTTNFTTAFQFRYRAAFCDTAIIMTIGQRSDSVILETLLYRIVDRDDRQGECKMFFHGIKRLDEKDWDSFTNEISYLDFWGLSSDNGRRGYDGSTLIVTGYLHPRNAFKGSYKKIYRWAAEESAIGSLFKKTFDLTGKTIRCFHYQ
jgi:hypothetical protein